MSADLAGRSARETLDHRLLTVGEKGFLMDMCGRRWSPRAPHRGRRPVELEVIWKMSREGINAPRCLAGVRLSAAFLLTCDRCDGRKFM